MERISNPLTFIFKIVLPIIWIVFVGSFVAVFLFSDEVKIGSTSRINFGIGLLLFFIAGVAALYFSLMSIKRVDADADFLYINNYFKMYRYPYHNIEKLAVERFGFLKFGRVYFRQAGYFGKSVFFLIDERKLNDFLAANPSIAASVNIKN